MLFFFVLVSSFAKIVEDEILSKIEFIKSCYNKEKDYFYSKHIY
jgi:hypothetical protein